MKVAPLDTFLFDLDGTLIDSVELILSSYRHTMQVHRGTVPPDHMWLTGLGTPITVQFRHFTDDPAEIEAMATTYRTHNHAHHDRLVREFPGVCGALSGLQARGAHLAIVTSKLRETALRGLECCGLSQFFDILVCADDVTMPKPDPEPVRRALECLRVSAERAVFVGDSSHDMKAGRAAGVRTAAALWGPFPRETLAAYTPDFWLSRPADISSLAESHAA